LKHGDIVFEVSGGSRTEGVARTARIVDSMLERWKVPVICASFCKLVRPLNEEISQYLFDHFRYLRGAKITEEFDKRSASSIVNYRWKDFLSQRTVLYPDSKVLEKYNSLSVPVYDKIIALSLQIESARLSRDMLLPKLMSGEIEL
jgi:type I restriction enzyme S subunit